MKGTASLRKVACAVGMLVLAARAAASVEDAIRSMRSEKDECGLLIALCKIARRSIERAESTPPTADFLSTRQSANANARAIEAADAARAIERKRGRRLACFDDVACAGIVPTARR
jgi:hypothetical protein